jgi:RNA processing factor Prp31
LLGQVLRGAKDAEMIADLSTRSRIDESMQKLKGEMMELSDSKLAEFKRDLMACPITDKDFETVQDMLAICESVRRAR